MGSRIVIPIVNPIKFVPKDIQDTGNIFLLDKYNYPHSVQPFEAMLPYFQKWVSGDIIRLQVWAENVDTCVIDIVDCEGNLLFVVSAGANPPDLLIGGIAYKILQLDFDTINLPVGIFFMVLRLSNTGSTSPTLFISEPQQMMAILKPSILFRYKNSYNEFNTIFKTSYVSNFEQDFYFRVEGRIWDMKPAGMFEVYDDQRLNQVQLSAKPFETWKFSLGGAYGLPEWMSEKLNMIRSCDTVTTDQYQWTFKDDFEKKNTANYTRFLYEITARQTVIEYAKEYDICVPVNGVGGAGLMPDALVNEPYIYDVVFEGSAPFTVQAGALIIPAWMSYQIIETATGGIVRLTGTPTAGAANEQVFINIGNPCGGFNFQDNIAVISCVPVTIISNNLPTTIPASQPFDATIITGGSLPIYVYNASVKPVWMDVTVTNSEIRIQSTGGGYIPGSYDYSFRVDNACGSTIVSGNVEVT